MFLNIAMFMMQYIALFVTKMKSPLLSITPVSLGDNGVHGFQSNNQGNMKFYGVANRKVKLYNEAKEQREVLGQREILHWHQGQRYFYTYIKQNVKFYKATKQNVKFYTDIKENLKFLY